MTFYSVVYMVHVWWRRNSFTRILWFSWAFKSRSAKGILCCLGEILFPLFISNISSDRSTRRRVYTGLLGRRKTGREEKAFHASTLVNYSPGWRNLWMAFVRNPCGTRHQLTWFTTRNNRKTYCKRKVKAMFTYIQGRTIRKDPDFMTFGNSKGHTAYQVLNK